MSNFFGDSYKIKNRSFPKPDEFYTVVMADNLYKISRWAYGYNRVPELINANSKLLQTRIDSGKVHTDLGGIPIVYEGDLLWIPSAENKIKETETIDSDSPD